MQDLSSTNKIKITENEMKICKTLIILRQNIILYFSSWSGFSDEFLYAAAWLFRATGKNTYRVEYNRWWTEFGLSWRPSDASWDMKLALAQILLAKIDGSPQYVNAARTFCDWLVNEAPRTPLGRGTYLYSHAHVYITLVVMVLNQLNEF